MSLGMQRTEVDGIPVFWTPWEHEPHYAEVIFRVGVADETLPLRGVTHLIEHLALFDFGQPRFSYNGTVQQKLTVFNAVGRADEVRQFVGDLGRALADLPYDRLKTEKRILEVEEAGRGVAARARLKQSRFGASTYGTLVKREIARPLLDPDTIERWRRDWFTSGNVVITITGEPPDTFGIELPDGPRRPPPAPKQLDGLALPAVEVRSEGEVAIGMVGPRSDAFRTVMYVAERRLIDCLRRERGVVYDVDRSVEVLGTDQQHAFLSLDCTDEHAAFAADRLLEILRELADHGPTEEELEDERDGVRRTLEYHDTPLDEIHDAGRDELVGLPVRPMTEWLEAVEALSVSDCARALAAALPTAIVEVPPAVGDFMPPGFHAYDVERPDLPRPDGPAFREKDETDCPVRPCEYTLGEEHLHLQPGDGGDPSTVVYDDVAGVIGEAGATVRIVTVDERRLEISRFKFIEGDALVAALGERIPAHLWLPPTVTAQAVDRLAAAQLQQPELVTTELQDLARNLREDELPLALATDALADDEKPGLIAVSTERLFFTWAEPSGDERKDVWNETERSEIAEPRVEADDKGHPQLVFAIDGERFDINGIESAEAAERLVAALSGAQAPGDRGAPASGVSSGG